MSCRIINDEIRGSPTSHSLAEWAKCRQPSNAKPKGPCMDSCGRHVMGGG